jgi:hypothetical protein
VTPVPQGANVQEIVRQSLIRTHSPLNQPLDFSDIREQLQGIGLLQNPLGVNTTNPTKTLIPGVGGPDIPPSPPDSSPSSSRGEYSDEGSSSSDPSQPLTPPTPMENQNNLPDLGLIKMSWLYLDPNTHYRNI